VSSYCRMENWRLRRGSLWSKADSSASIFRIDELQLWEFVLVLRIFGIIAKIELHGARSLPRLGFLTISMLNFL